MLLLLHRVSSLWYLLQILLWPFLATSLALGTAALFAYLVVWKPPQRPPRLPLKPMVWSNTSHALCIPYYYARQPAHPAAIRLHVPGTNTGTLMRPC